MEMFLAFFLLSVDYLQTIEISKNKDYLETNVAIGPSAKRSAVDRYFAVVAGGVGAIGLIPNRKAKQVAYIFVIATEANQVHKNHKLGIRININ